MTGKQVLATKEEIDAAFDQLDPDLIDALGYAADNIRRFHEQQKPEQEWSVEIRPGLMSVNGPFPFKKLLYIRRVAKAAFRQ